MQPKALSGHFTIKEAATYTGLSVSSLRRYVKSKVLPAKRLGLWRYVFEKADLDALAVPFTAGRPQNDCAIRHASGVLLPI